MLLAVAVVASMLSTVIAAYADTTYVDNDTAAGKQNTVSLSAVTGATVTTSAQIYIQYGGSHHLTAGMVVVMAVDTAATTLPGGYTVAQPSLTIPSPWNTNGETAGPAVAGVSFTAPATAGSYSYLVQWDSPSADSPNLTGNPTLTVNVTVTVPPDTTAPSTSIALSPSSPNASGWYSSDVTATVTATDPDDSVAATRCVLDPTAAPTSYDQLPSTACAFAATAGAAVSSYGAHTLYAAAIDSHGNKGAVVSRGFSIDETAPTTTVALTPATANGLNGWYTSGVTVLVSASDADDSYTIRCALDPATAPTGFADLPATACAYTASGGVLVATTGEHHIYAAAVDGHGNVGSLASGAFSIDLTAPTTSITLDPSAPNGPAGWYSSDVTATVSASDEDTYTIRCVLDPTSAPSTFEDLPATACPYTGGGDTVSAYGGHTLYAAAVDSHGNEGAVVSASFSIDETAPSATIALDPTSPNSLGWYNSDVTATVAATDPDDSVSAIRCVLDPVAAPVTYDSLPAGPCAYTGAGGGTISTYGPHTLYAAGIDGHGNEGTVQSATFSIDTTAPASEIVLSPAAPNTLGWYTSDVTITVSATDVDDSSTIRCVLDPTTAPAAFQDLPSTTCPYAGGGAAVSTYGEHTVYAAAVDGHGNEGAVVSTAFSVDETAPTASIALSPAAPNSLGWYNSDVTATVTATDPDDPVSAIRCVLDPATAPASYEDLPASSCAYASTGGATISTYGPHTLYAAAADGHGNEGAVQSTTFSLDKTAPATSIGLSPASPNSLGWYNSDVTVSVTASDVDDTVSAIRCVLDPASAPATFADLPSTTCGYAAAGGAAVQTYGQHTIYAASADGHGNDGTVQSISFNLDETAPTSSVTLNPGSPNGSNGWYTSDVTVTVAATDVDDPVSTIRCALDPASVPGSFDDLPSTSCGFVGGAAVHADGQHTIYAAATDSHGNKGAITSASFKIDETAPVVTITAPANGAQYYLDQTVDLSYTTSDATSGLDTASITDVPSLAEGAPIDTTTPGAHTFTVSDKDEAGNETSVTVTYHVGYHVNGLLSPVVDPSSVNNGKGGQTYPLKWQLTDANGNYVSTANVESLDLYQVSAGSFLADETSTLTAVSSTDPVGLRYDYTDQQYIYNWGTTKGMAGNYYILVITLDSGQQLEAYFQFK